MLRIMDAYCDWSVWYSSHNSFSTAFALSTFDASHASMAIMATANSTNSTPNGDTNASFSDCFVRGW